MHKDEKSTKIEKGVSRRHIIFGMVGLGIGTIAFGSIVSAVRFLWPPEKKFGAAVGEGGDGGAIILVDELKVGESHYFNYNDNQAVLTRFADGFYAIGVICTHLGCICKFQPDKEILWCACHSAVFDPKTGDVIAGPPPSKLPKLKTEIRQTEKGDGVFIIDWENPDYIATLSMYH